MTITEIIICAAVSSATISVFIGYYLTRYGGDEPKPKCYSCAGATCRRCGGTGEGHV